MSADPKIWLGAIMSLGIYSYLYRENPFFRTCEHAYMGLALAHLAVMGWTNVRDVGLKKLGDGQLVVLIPLVLGMLLFTRWSPKYGWLSRYSLAYFVGVAAAVTITGVLDAGIISQVRGAMKPVNSLDSFIALFCNVTAISVFFFIVGSSKEVGPVLGSKPVRTAMGWAANAGRVVMMISFGAVFGTTVMARLGLFVPRLKFLFGDWIHLIPVK